MPKENILSKFIRSPIEKIKIKKHEYIMATIEIVLSALIGFLVAGIVLYVMGYDPGEVFYIMFIYGFNDPEYLCGKAIPLIMTGLAFSIPSLAGVFNIGGESQLYWGAFIGLITTYYVTQYTGIGTLGTITGILAGILAGAAWALLIAVLRIYRGINEVITAIMLNWISYFTIIYLIIKFFTNPVIPHQSIEVPEKASLTPYPGFAIAIIGTLIVYYLLYHTDIGYKMRVSGLSPASAKYAGFDPSKAILSSMIIGGGSAGLGGSLLILAISHNIDTTMSTIYGLGFTGIGVGLLGRNHPIGIIFSALFFAGLLIGGQWVELKTGAPPMLSDAIMGIIVIALSAPYAYRLLMNYLSRLRKR